MPRLSNPRVPSIPVPDKNPDNMLATTSRLKEAVELLAGQRGNKLHSSVSWQDLLDLELITPDQVPRR